MKAETDFKSIMTRRRFLTLALAAAPTAALANAVAVEPDYLKVTRLRLAGREVRHRFIHISDLHHRNDHSFTEKIINAVRREKPDFVCFTGDLIDSIHYLPGASEFIRSLDCPVFGIPGNHDHYCTQSFQAHERAFAATGGGWLVDRKMIGDHLEIIGLDRYQPRRLPEKTEAFRLVLSHYPAQADLLTGGALSLVLAGHSHGGQVRVPFLGAVVLPEGVGLYDRGLFKAKAGLLHVSAGLGTSTIPIRFNCRPEMTVVEI